MPPQKQCVVPVGWFIKVQLLQQRSTQLSWGHGTHKLAISKPQLRTLRADTVRCLLNADDYCASPMAIFTILAPPSLDPEFCLHSNAIRLLQQALQASGDHQHFTQIVGATLPAHDGPAARAFELLQHDAFRDTVQSILNNRPLSPQHPHELRQSWRKYVWNNLARDRPQTFAGAQHGIQKNLSTSLLELWSAEAGRLQADIDAGRCVPPEFSSDPRPRMKVLRLLLVGGLLSPEANHRHRKLPGAITCGCGGNPTNHHISWECPLFKDLRAPALAALSRPIESFPMCFQYTTLVPENITITQRNLHQIQTSLVNIWQRHIQDWHNYQEQDSIQCLPSTQPTSSQLEPSAASSSTLPPGKNGHILQPMPEGNVLRKMWNIYHLHEAHPFKHFKEAVQILGQKFRPTRGSQHRNSSSTAYTIDKENPESLQQPRRRIRGKTKIDTNPNANSVPETAHVSPTTSHVSHSASSSGGPALPRAGIG